MRLRRGRGGGKTVSLDRMVLTSRRLALIGRPERLIKTGSTIIPEECEMVGINKPTLYAYVREEDRQTG